MAVDPALLSVRFGLGRAPGRPDPAHPLDLLAPLPGPDAMAARYPLPGFATIHEPAQQMRAAFRAVREDPGNAEAHRERGRRIRGRTLRAQQRLIAPVFARMVATSDPFRERLVRFWADHFTVVGKGGILRFAASLYAEDAIRPHVAGRFADLLKAAILHPMMVDYLDQNASVGPGSALAQRRPGRGLNENLARELMELHTLGVSGSYGQQDVRQLAELLAGLVGGQARPIGFQPRRGEPGPEEVLGRAYGDEEPRLADIEAALEDLARHADTAQHIARKLCTHFVADSPDPALVAHVAARFVATDGWLPEVCAALLEHPAAHAPAQRKARQPWDFMAAGLRALAVDPDALAALDLRAVRRQLRGPLAAMGQTWERPIGPDGWPEDAEHWITPQGLAGRIAWALKVQRFTGGALPDPRAFVEAALGPLAGEGARFAAAAAETRAEGIALVLVAPEFQRR